MLRIKCPFCGVRSHTEFTYFGDATKKRPASGASRDEWLDFVYLRDNPKGPHDEYWQHALGCRGWVKVSRDTLTHAIANVELMSPSAGRSE